MDEHQSTGELTMPAAGDKLLIDKIAYLTTLVSDPTAVDPMLDALRAITATMQPGTPLDDADRQKLHALEAKLKDYLINNDPVRSFTPESLDETLDRNFANGKQHAVKTELLAIIAITILTYGCSVILSGTDLRRQALVMSPVALTLLNFGIAWFFWSSRKDYAHEIRRMYNYFSTGVIIRSITLVQFPVLLAFPQLKDLPIFQYVGFLPPFILMSFIFYVGMIQYARQLKLKTPFMALGGVLGIGAFLTIAVFIFSHPVKAASEALFNLSFVSFLLSAYFSVPAAALARAVAHRITPRYALSMRLLALSQILFAANCISFIVMLFVVSGPLTNLEIGLTAIPFALPEVLLLLSAYNAKKAVSELSHKPA